MRSGNIGGLSIRAVVITILIMVLPTSALAHFSVLVTDTPSVRRGQTAEFRFYKGHPFECEIVETPAPEKIEVLAPDGKRVRLDPKPRPVNTPDGGKVTTWTFAYTPEVRGDHLVLVTTTMAFDEHGGGFVQDEVRLTLHVQTQQGWDAPSGAAIDLLPLTRPYGLEPGFAFKAQARLHGKPLTDAMVEVEKYHAQPPKELPDDDALITRAVKTDVNGYLICTLNQPGWWGLLVTAEDGRKEQDGKEHPVVRRGVLWVYVAEDVRSER